MKNKWSLKILSLVLLLTLVISAGISVNELPGPVQAQPGETVEGTNEQAGRFSGGSGTPDDPYLVATADDLNNVRKVMDAHFLQIADIDLGVPPWNEGEGWIPIGWSQSGREKFTGIYNGGGYLIRNLTIERAERNQGLFTGTDINGWLLNINLRDVQMDVSGSSGSLVGYANSTTIMDSSATGNINIVREPSGITPTIVGGLVGNCSGDGVLSNVYTDMNIIGNANFLGGLVGGSKCDITHSYSLGSVEGYMSIGGLVGSAGCIFRKLNITDSFSRSSVIADFNGGGLIGHLFRSSVENVYSTGHVIGDSDYSVGGLIGSIGEEVDITNSYWDVQASGQDSSSAGIGRTTEQMTYPYDIDTYVGWDFEDTWVEDDQYVHNDGYPYLDPDPDLGVYVRISGVNRFSPGEVLNYAVTYANFQQEAIQDAVLVVRLPYRAALKDSSISGIHWYQRNEVFWKLEELAPGTVGRVYVSVEYDWGIPEDDLDSLFAMLLGSTFTTELDDLQSYLGYEPLVVTSAESISLSEWEGELPAIPDLGTLYAQSLDAGYLFATAERVSLSDGTTSLQAILIEPEERIFRFLYNVGDHPLVATFTSTSAMIKDTTGGLIWNATTDEITYWGAWDLEGGEAAIAFQNSSVRGGGIGCCLNNCLLKTGVSFTLGKISTILSHAMSAVGCRNAFRDGDPIDMAKCGNKIFKKIPYFGESLDAQKCLRECIADPNSHDCTRDKRECVPAKFPFTLGGSREAVEITKCRDGCYLSLKSHIHCGREQCCRGGRCVFCGGGTRSFTSPDNMTTGCDLASRGAVYGGCDCQENECTPAIDPNEKYGPAGHLLPGELVTYTIEYENVGAGEAYGVYILDELDEAFDASTLDIGPNATYSPSTRIIDWDIGTVAPAGELGSTGEVTFSVRLKDDLPGGTIIINQAVIYFPTVPQEEPTSSLVNIIQSVVAETQSLTTNYATPIAFTLSGREVADAALTYRVVEEPSYGTLTGIPPNLTYTPMEDFVGMDRFAFVVNNGVMDSSPAQVYITVTPDGDTRPPTVLWTEPADSSVVQPSFNVLYTDDIGPIYTPRFLIGFSEPLDPDRVDNKVVMLSGGIDLVVYYDGASNRIVAYPRSPLQGNQTYIVTVNTGITDLAGNPMAKDYQWTFTTEEGLKQIFLPLLIR